MRSKRAIGVLLAVVVTMQVFAPVMADDSVKMFFVEQLWRIDGAKVSVLHTTLDGFFILKQNSSGTTFDYLDNKTGKSLWQQENDIDSIKDKFTYWGISEGKAVLSFPGRLDFYDVTTGKKSSSMDGLPEIENLYSSGDYIFILTKTNNNIKPQISRIDAVMLKVISSASYPQTKAQSGSLRIVGFIGEDALFYSSKFELIRFDPGKAKIVWRVQSKQGVYPKVEIACGKIVTMKFISTTCGEVGKAVCVLDPSTGKEIWNHPYEGEYAIAYDKIFLWNDNYCDKPSEKFYIINIETGVIRKILDCSFDNPVVAANDNFYCIAGSTGDNIESNYLKVYDRSLDNNYWRSTSRFDWPDFDIADTSLSMTFNDYLLVSTGSNRIEDGQGFICLKMHGLSEKTKFDRKSLWELEKSTVITSFEGKFLIARKNDDGIIKKLDLVDIESGLSLWGQAENVMTQDFVGKKLDDLKYAANGRNVVFWRASGQMAVFDILSGSSRFIGNELADCDKDGVFDGEKFATRDKENNLVVIDLAKSGTWEKYKLPLENGWQLVAMKGEHVFAYDKSVKCFDLSTDEIAWKSDHVDKTLAEIDRSNSFATGEGVVCAKKPDEESDYSVWVAEHINNRVRETGGAFQGNVVGKSSWIGCCLVSDDGKLLYGMTDLVYGVYIQMLDIPVKIYGNITSLSLSMWNNYILVAVNDSNGSSQLVVLDGVGRMIDSVPFSKTIDKIYTFWNNILVGYKDGSLESIKLPAKD